MRPHISSLLALLMALALPLSACTNDSATRSTLEKSGFTDVQVTGYRPFNCGENDLSSTGFTAKNVNGSTVEGVVCCGILKGCTVRF